MYKIPAKINYFQEGTPFWHVNPENMTITYFIVKEVHLAESADMYEMPKLVYTVKREDGKTFQVKTNFIHSSFKSLEAAELAVNSNRYEPLYEEYQEMMPDVTIDVRKELVTNYNVLEEQIEEEDGWLSVYAWRIEKGETIRVPMDMTVTIKDGFNVYIEAGMYRTEKECPNVNPEYCQHIKILLTFAVNEAIKSGNFSDKAEVTGLWERSETFTQCVLEALRVMGAKEFDDAEMCLVNEYVHDTVESILFQQGIPYSIE